MMIADAMTFAELSKFITDLAIGLASSRIVRIAGRRMIGATEHHFRVSYCLASFLK